MTQYVRTAVVAVLAFGIGFAMARAPLTARAAAQPLQPAAIDLLALAPSALPTPSSAFPNLQSKTLVVTDGMTAAFQTGLAPRHYHASANEVQIFLAGTGTEWLGDQQVPIKPGTMVVIPMGTNHAGFTVASGPLKFVSIKTPPQDPTDVHMAP